MDKKFWVNFHKYGAAVPKEIIAQKINRSLNTAYVWTRGRKDHSLNKVFALCAAIDVDFFALIGVLDGSQPCKTNLDDLRQMVSGDLDLEQFGKIKLSGVERMLVAAYPDKESLKEAVNAKYRERN